MIERKNIIKLLSDRAKGNVFHSAVLTCYNFDPIFFESVYLPSLRSLGITNVIVLMDASMYDKMLADSSYACHRVSLANYTLVRQENIHHGVFHSKIVLLFGEEDGALVVGSGNLTFSGLSNNEEVWNVFHVAGNESVHYPLLLKAWNYVKDILHDTLSLVEKQLGWITEQSLWLQDGNYPDVVTLESGEECSVICNGVTKGILDYVAEAIGDANIEEITVIAPFYDSEGHALTELRKRFRPNQMSCILDLQRQSAPFELLNSNTDIAFYKHTASNPLHAKIIEFKSDGETWLLSGSANAGNMALGLSHTVYNDETCVLIHSFEGKNYIEELGIQYELLNDDERKSVVRPTQTLSEASTKKTKLKACEEREGRVYLHFSDSGVNGCVVILDKKQREIYKEDIVTDETVELLIDESLLDQFHMAVLKDYSGMNISNHCLVVKELHVESCNPDPKRRKLSSLLDDDGLLQNLNHILGYIEFDENDKKSKTVSITAKGSKSADKEDIVVQQSRFNELKDSSLSISMHSGVRILAYLQQILFKKEDTERSDDDLLEIDKEENGCEDTAVPAVSRQKMEVSSAADDANKMKSEIVKFLDKMQQFLMKKTEDSTIHGKAHPPLRYPELEAVPGLNASSSIAIASRSVVVLMNRYGRDIGTWKEIRVLLIKCSRLFFSIYANAIPTDNSNRSLKTRNLLKDASVDLLSALSFFTFGKDNAQLPIVVLNCLDIWHEKEELHHIISLYKDQLTRLDKDNLHQETIDRIINVANVFLDGDAPQGEFSSYDNVVYQYKKGYGFLWVDNIKLSPRVSYVCHGAWFEENLEFKLGGLKYKGYKDL